MPCPIRFIVSILSPNCIGSKPILLRRSGRPTTGTERICANPLRTARCCNTARSLHDLSVPWLRRYRDCHSTKRLPQPELEHLREERRFHSRIFQHRSRPVKLLFLLL